MLALISNPGFPILFIDLGVNLKSQLAPTRDGTSTKGYRKNMKNTSNVHMRLHRELDYLGQ